MNLTLLIDLDDTLLLKSSSDVFPAYLKALSNHLKFLSDPEIVLKELFHATAQMRENTDPGKTLKQIFDDAFYPKFGVTAQDLADSLVDFYTNTYPTLSTLSEPNPEAAAFIETCLEQGHTIAIATNPYFPALATRERLRWAGFPPEEYPFAVISSYETFHFTKPHAAYYAEMLARLGWSENPVIMIGNDYENDIAPAKSFGLATYHTETDSQNTASNNSGSGSLAEFFSWLESTTEENLAPDFEGIQPNLEIMRATPAALTQLLADVPLDAWKKRPLPDQWSITEILCHFRDVDREIHLPRFEMVRDNPNPFIKAIDADTWAEERNYYEQNGPQALSDFIQARNELLATIKDLPPTTDKHIQHTIFGPTTLDELVKIAARHDRLHIEQLYELLEI